MQKVQRAEGSLPDAERTIESVRLSASNLLSAFRSKLDLLRGRSEVTDFLIRQGFDGQTCFEEAIKFFGSDEVRYVAIDGTDFDESRLDMLIFYAGAFAYGGKIRFFETGEVVSEAPSSDNDSISLSAAIPLSEEYAWKVSGEVTEGGTEVDATKIPPSLMRLTEYFLAYNAILQDEDIRVMLMDRTVSGDIAHISWKMRDYIASGVCVLEGLQTSEGKITKLDLELARMLVKNKRLKIPAPRSQFLKFVAMDLLISEGNPISKDDIAGRIGAKEGRKEKVVRDLLSRSSFAEALELVEGTSTLKLRDGSVAKYWERLLEGALNICDHIFNFYDGQAESISGEHLLVDHPLLLKSENGEEARWIRAEDIDYLSLVLITALLQECWKRNILLLGIVKDSSANELMKTVVPLLEEAKLLNFSSREVPTFESDKMLLQANSLVNSEFIDNPWRTFEYDVCFRTISPVLGVSSSSERGACSVEGAFKNVIAAERMFVKAYFQLWKSERDPSVRSHVFLYDRPCYPNYDVCSPEEGPPELKMKNKDGTVEEEIVPAIHFLKDSRISDVVMGILYSMGTEAIPEVLGHNYALFLADKRAKVAESEALRGSISAVELEMSKSRLDQQILYEGKFRDYRSSIESKRRKRRRGSS